MYTIAIFEVHQWGHNSIQDTLDQHGICALPLVSESPGGKPSASIYHFHKCGVLALPHQLRIVGDYCDLDAVCKELGLFLTHAVKIFETDHLSWNDDWLVKLKEIPSV